MIFEQTYDSSRWPSFSPSELRCRHTGTFRMEEDFLDLLQAIRDAYGKPILISSAYRHTSHPVEVKKARGGAHTMGCAVDMHPADNDPASFQELLCCILDTCKERGAVVGIGIKARGFIHLDNAPPRKNAPRPALWTYP